MIEMVVESTQAERENVRKRYPVFEEDNVFERYFRERGKYDPVTNPMPISSGLERVEAEVLDAEDPGRMLKEYFLDQFPGVAPLIAYSFLAYLEKIEEIREPVLAAFEESIVPDAATLAPRLRLLADLSGRAVYGDFPSSLERIAALLGKARDMYYHLKVDEDPAAMDPVAEAAAQKISRDVGIINAKLHPDE